MERIHSEDQVSIVEDNAEILHGGYESDEVDSAPLPDPADYFTTNGLTKLAVGSGEYEMVRLSFLEYLGPHAEETSVVAVHKDISTSSAKRARLDAFMTFGQAMGRKYGGKANMRMAWYVGGSKEEINGIVSHGFSRCSDGSGNGESHGVGIYLTPLNRLVNAVAGCPVDEDGVRHILLCHVILGNMEAIPAGSKQCYPSSAEFDSGVDNPSEPGRYVVWSAYMNSHIMATFVISFKSSSFNGLGRIQMGNKQKYAAPRLTITAFIALLSPHLNPTKRTLVAKCYDEFRKNNISRQRLIEGVRRIVRDDNLLAAVIKSSRNKQQIVMSVPPRESSDSGGSRG